MSVSQAMEMNRRIEEECRAKFLGTASVKCSSLNFPAENVKGNKEGGGVECGGHHVIALISQKHLDAAMEAANIPTARLLTDSNPYQELDLPPHVQLDCICGIMVESALDGIDKRCVVNLFLDSMIPSISLQPDITNERYMVDLSQELTTFFFGESRCEKEPDDGEFYCKIRQYQGLCGEANPYCERMWLARLSALSENRRELFDQLSRHRKYSAAFNAVLCSKFRLFFVALDLPSFTR